jgi:hypothetical protein
MSNCRTSGISDPVWPRNKDTRNSANKIVAFQTIDLRECESANLGRVLAIWVGERFYEHVGNNEDHSRADWDRSPATAWLIILGEHHQIQVVVTTGSGHYSIKVAIPKFPWEGTGGQQFATNIVEKM